PRAGGALWVGIDQADAAPTPQQLGRNVDGERRFPNPALALGEGNALGRREQSPPVMRALHQPASVPDRRMSRQRMATPGRKAPLPQPTLLPPQEIPKIHASRRLNARPIGTAQETALAGRRDVP